MLLALLDHRHNLLNSSSFITDHLFWSREKGVCISHKHVVETTVYTANTTINNKLEKYSYSNIYMAFMSQFAKQIISPFSTKSIIYGSKFNTTQKMGVANISKVQKL